MKYMGLSPKKNKGWLVKNGGICEGCGYEYLNRLYNIEEIRKAVGKLAWAIYRQNQRRLMPYDWLDYGHQELIALIRLCNVNIDGELLKQDKKGSWRVMKDASDKQKGTEGGKDG